MRPPVRPPLRPPLRILVRVLTPAVAVLASLALAGLLAPGASATPDANPLPLPLPSGGGGPLVGEVANVEGPLINHISLK